MNKKKNKIIIDKYIRPIYIPHILYVCKYYTKEDIDKMFEFTDGTSIIEEETGQYSATTCYGVRDKATKKLCIVVLLSEELTKHIRKNKEEVWNTCSHEAFHVADEILRYCDIQLCDGSKESYAYMVGWAAECIFKTVAK